MPRATPGTDTAQQFALRSSRAGSCVDTVPASRTPHPCEARRNIDSTCHIYVTEGGDTAPESSEAEEDQLDFAPAVRDCSRLSCQCVPDGSEDVVVEIPSWKRNEVSEDH